MPTLCKLGSEEVCDAGGLGANSEPQPWVVGDKCFGLLARRFLVHFDTASNKIHVEARFYK